MILDNNNSKAFGYLYGLIKLVKHWNRVNGSLFNAEELQDNVIMTDFSSITYDITLNIANLEIREMVQQNIKLRERFLHLVDFTPSKLFEFFAEYISNFSLTKNKKQEELIRETKSYILHIKEDPASIEEYLSKIFQY